MLGSERETGEQDALGKAETPTDEPSDGQRLPIVILNRDLMFGVQVGNVVRALGLAPRFVRTTDAFTVAMRQQEPAPALGILDMNGAVDWPSVAALVSESGIPPVLAFGPHVDVEGRRAAKAAGVTRIVSNGEFHRSMGELIGRYAQASNR